MGNRKRKRLTWRQSREVRRLDRDLRTLPLVERAPSARRLAKIWGTVRDHEDLAQECTELAEEIDGLNGLAGYLIHGVVPK